MKKSNNPTFSQMAAEVASEEIAAMCWGGRLTPEGKRVARALDRTFLHAKVSTEEPARSTRMNLA